MTWAIPNINFERWWLLLWVYLKVKCFSLVVFYCEIKVALYIIVKNYMFLLCELGQSFHSLFYFGVSMLQLLLVIIGFLIRTVIIIIPFHMHLLNNLCTNARKQVLYISLRSEAGFLPFALNLRIQFFAELISFLIFDSSFFFWSHKS